MKTQEYGVPASASQAFGFVLQPWTKNTLKPGYRTRLFGVHALACSSTSLALPALAFIAAFVTLPHCAFAQKQNLDRPAPYEASQGERDARKLIDDIFHQRPASDAPTNGTLKMWDTDRKEREVRVRMQISETPTNWIHIYETLPANGKQGDKLTITHTPAQPTRYMLTKAGETTATELSGNQTMVSFAGSDFWVADLGLEFLHWPKQRLVKKEMRYHKSSVMLESINPSPATGAYARVDSWLTIDLPHSPVLAKAYDSSGKQIKEFTPEDVERVEGKYQLHSIEMRNLKTKTKSVIEFALQ